MNSDLLTILSLRRVLESAEAGMGLSQSLVRELRGLRPLGRESARMLLLGFPLVASLRPLAECSSEEVSMLASLIISAPRSSSTLVGKSGGALAGTLERWVKARESGRMELRVLRFRSLVTSAVLGAVTAMMASLGPLVANLDLTGTLPPANSGTFLLAAAGFTAMSSGMLGLFMSGRGFYVNVVVSLLVFALVCSLASPLANVPLTGLWGVK
jgi:hypothetical protein